MGEPEQTNKPAMRQQRIERTPPAKKPTVIDVRTKQPTTADPQGNPVLMPVRTVVYVEVGDMDVDQVTELVRQYATQYEGAVFGPHYVIPVRQGRLGSEMEFEAQFLETVQEMCEVRDGQIVLKDGARNVQVMRTHVGDE